jgi:predicted NBD/HSP70 family sugar kinase
MLQQQYPHSNIAIINGTQRMPFTLCARQSGEVYPMPKLVLRLVKSCCIQKAHDIEKPELRLGGVSVDPAGNVQVALKFKFCTFLDTGKEQPAWQEGRIIGWNFCAIDVDPGAKGQYFAAMALCEHNKGGGLDDYSKNLKKDLDARFAAARNDADADGDSMDKKFQDAFASAMKKHMDLSLSPDKLAQQLTQGAAEILETLAHKADLDDAFRKKAEPLFKELFDLLAEGRVGDLEERAKARKARIMKRVKDFLSGMPDTPDFLEKEIADQVEKLLDRLIKELKGLTDEQMQDAADAFIKTAADLLMRVMSRAMAERSIRQASKLLANAISLNPLVAIVLKGVIAAIAENLLELLKNLIEDRIFTPHLAAISLPAGKNGWQEVPAPGTDIKWAGDTVLKSEEQIAEYEGFGGHYKIHYCWLLG